jgi:hypothetical protein
MFLALAAIENRERCGGKPGSATEAVCLSTGRYLFGGGVVVVVWEGGQACGTAFGTLVQAGKDPRSPS